MVKQRKKADKAEKKKPFLKRIVKFKRITKKTKPVVIRIKKFTPAPYRSVYFKQEMEEAVNAL